VGLSQGEGEDIYAEADYHKFIVTEHSSLMVVQRHQSQKHLVRRVPTKFPHHQALGLRKPIDISS
jgi:hypothetical protein